MPKLQQEPLGPRQEIIVLLCFCRSFRFGHRPEEHKKLRSDLDWRTPSERGNVEYWEESVR
jgi:hypothetical protein